MFNTTLTVKGRLTRDPELRFLPSGIAVCSISIVDQPRKFNKDTKEWDNQTPVYWEGSLWREVAENVAENLTKGDTVIAVGRPVMDTYTDKEQQTQRRLKLQVDEIAVVVDKFTSVKVQRAGRGSSRDDSRSSVQRVNAVRGSDWDVPAADPFSVNEPPF